ncbi:dynein intermediate chain 2, ciliary [Plasmodium yoelii yoelii]|uniref:Dynein intermediate chain 2, ciliary n=1 Tax=Plasmodium yoelii yoelii TaxID=73239 RepID=Q7RT17_PLAYO|nr:dynein intermediate chain 2, ciliary [Plasmodium yoelii yoelii]
MKSNLLEKKKKKKIQGLSEVKGDESKATESSEKKTAALNDEKESYNDKKEDEENEKKSKFNNEIGFEGCRGEEIKFNESSTNYSDNDEIEGAIFYSSSESENNSFISNEDDYNDSIKYSSQDKSDKAYETEHEEKEGELSDKDENEIDENGNIEEGKDSIDDNSKDMISKNNEQIDKDGECEKKTDNQFYIDNKKKKKKYIKKKIDEPSNGKHDLYFINYKDLNEKTHKDLNFIYCDNKIKKSDNKIIYKKRFLKTLKIMDRIYNKNNEEDIYLCYKNKNNKNILTKLWAFTLNACQFTVTDIKFHPFYEDLFAISFKSNDIKTNMGILCCFTFKNTKNPEHVIKTNFHIYSIEWSNTNNSIIIIGLSNGSICIYDLNKKKNERLIFESNLKNIYNRDIISQIYFHKQNKTFYSVSYDGNIYYWKYNSKFTTGEKLLTLKKNINDFDGALNTTQTQSITCIDFNPFKINMFLIGTNNGTIYLYSSAYSDNYLRLYNEHTMSINCISYNKFKRNVFISSSYDWTIRIWDQNQTTSLIVFDTKECIYDVKWSPFLSTCFFVISANNCGHLHIYDLSIDINKAIASEIITKKKKLRKLSVNNFNEVILIGEENGVVYTYKVSYKFNQTYMDYLKGKISYSFQNELMDIFLGKVK